MFYCKLFVNPLWDRKYMIRLCLRSIIIVVFKIMYTAQCTCTTSLKRQKDFNKLYAYPFIVNYLKILYGI